MKKLKASHLAGDSRSIISKIIEFERKKRKKNKTKKVEFEHAHEKTKDHKENALENKG